MSTRCDIIIKDDNTKTIYKELKLYHHHDGYPEGVGKFLIEELTPELNHPYITGIDIANFLIKHPKDNEFELTVGEHCDIEYRYIINVVSREIKCYSGHYTYDKNDKSKFEIYDTIDLKKFLPLESEVLYR